MALKVVFDAGGVKCKVPLFEGKVKVADVLQVFGASAVTFMEDGISSILTSGSDGLSTDSFQAGATVGISIEPLPVPRGVAESVPTRPIALGHDDRSIDVVAMLKESFSEMARSVSNEIASTVSKGIVLALKPLTAQLRRTPSIAQSEITPRSESFKKELIQSYMDVEGPVAEIPCYVTGLLLPSFEVIAGHIFPMRAHTFITDFIPDVVSINDTRNGILWAAPIEQAFELSLMCFEWDEISHTLMPIVLDKNLMGKNLLEGMRYMKQLASGSTNIVEEDLGGECVQAASPTEGAECGNITSAEVKIKMSDIIADVKSMNLSAKKSEQLRHKEFERVFRSYIDGLYKNVFFERLHLQRKQFPVQVKMSGRAFKVTAILAFQEAKRRGVLPTDLAFNPQKDQTHYEPIDVYLMDDATVSELLDELNVSDVDSEDSSSYM